MEKQPPRPASSKPTPLTFRPITPGLGFHPFSDGLPYAPVGKTQSSNSGSAPASASASLGRTPYSTTSAQGHSHGQSHGSGAMSAGAAIPVTPQPTGIRGIQVPTAVKPAPRISVPVATAQSSAGKATRVEPAPAPLRNLEPGRFGFFYLIKRMLAYSIDTALNTALCVTALSAALVRQDLNPDTLFSPGVVLLFSLFLIVFNWALIAAQEVAFGTSVGKRIFGLTLNGNASATFLRAFFFLPSIGFCGVGLIWSLFNRRRRCWHDSAVDLQPLELARL